MILSVFEIFIQKKTTIAKHLLEFICYLENQHIQQIRGTDHCTCSKLAFFIFLKYVFRLGSFVQKSWACKMRCSSTSFTLCWRYVDMALC